MGQYHRAYTGARDETTVTTSRTFFPALFRKMPRLAEVFKSIVGLLLAADPVDRWVLRTCRSHGTDCTITWRRLLTALAAMAVATFVCFIIRIRRERWDVSLLSPMRPHWSARIWANMHHIKLPC